MLHSATFFSALLIGLLSAEPQAVDARSHCDRELATQASTTHITLEEALKLALPDCQVERATVYLTDDQKKRAEDRKSTRLNSSH